jgi:hypothetical protein
LKELPGVNHSQSHKQNASRPNPAEDLIILFAMRFRCRKQHTTNHHRTHCSTMVFTTNSRPVFVSRSMLPSRSSQTKIINKLRESLTLKRFGATISNKLSALEM